MANWKIEKHFSSLKYNCKRWLHLPSVEVSFEDKDITPSLCIDTRQASLSLSYQFWSLLRLSLNTGHSTSSFISRLFSNLSSHWSETHFFIFPFVKLPLTHFQLLCFCQSSHVSQLSILYCCFATHFWGRSVSHAVINFPHLPVLSSFFFFFNLLWLFSVYSTLFLDPSPLHSSCFYHLSGWVSIDIPN